LEQSNGHKANTDAWNDDTWLPVVLKKLHIKWKYKSEKVHKKLRVVEFTSKFKVQIDNVSCSAVEFDVSGVLIVKFEHQISEVDLSDVLLDLRTSTIPHLLNLMS